MPNIFEDEFTGRLDLSSEETAMYVYDVAPRDWLPYHYESSRSGCSWSTAPSTYASRTARSSSFAAR